MTEQHQAGTAAVAQQVVTIISQNVASSGLLLRFAPLDGDGQRTLSVTGCKSGIPGRARGEKLIVRLHNGAIVPATITHIHKTHDRFRAEVETRHLATAGLNLVAEMRTSQTRKEDSVVYVDALRKSPPSESRSPHG